MAVCDLAVRLLSSLFLKNKETPAKQGAMQEQVQQSVAMEHIYQELYMYIRSLVVITKRWKYSSKRCGT